MTSHVWIVESRSRRGKNWYPGSSFHGKRYAEKRAQELRGTGSALLYRVTKYTPEPR